MKKVSKWKEHYWTRFTICSIQIVISPVSLIQCYICVEYGTLFGIIIYMWSFACQRTRKLQNPGVYIYSFFW
jgi:hypothetical protein